MPLPTRLAKKTTFTPAAHRAAQTPKPPSTAARDKASALPAWQAVGAKKKEAAAFTFMLPPIWIPSKGVYMYQ